jgi:two-component system, NtrC family, sensor histidine kinase KinB
MKNSIRTRFTLGMIFLFLIILVLSVYSGYLVNKLSTKTSAILKENYLSVVYAREMSEGLMNINQEIISCFLKKRNSDSLKIKKELSYVDKSLQLEKNNITEPGEDKLVSGIETDFYEYRDSVQKLMKIQGTADGVVSLQNLSGNLYQQLLLLSQMNGKALEIKTDDAKDSSKSAVTRMTILATLCFLIGMSFIFSFSTYFNQRFFQLYYGIKEVVSSNYNQKLFFDGNDEFYEISLVINEMAEKLKKNKQKMSVTLQEDFRKGVNSNDIEELQKMLFRIKVMEEQAAALLLKFEKRED